jgi:Zn-finger nucleic acid-binding protein
MKCPVCKTPDLVMTERRSIEIDYCPTCRGVWLDRGELDKLVAQEAAHESAIPDSGRTSSSRRDDYHERDRHYENGRKYDDDRSGHRGYRKKRSLFDMFDFD